MTMLINRRDVLASMVATAAVSTLPRAAGSAANGALDFLIVGDWGRNGTSHQREVAAQMGQSAKGLHSPFVISVGDNFYDDGVQSPSDPQWRSSFEDIYTARSLQVPWYVALGNHDYRGVPQAQIDYATTSSRWRMPNRYYKVAGGELSASPVDFFFIDTSPLVHKYRDNVHSVIAKNVSSQDVAAQLRWLDDQLGTSTAAWKLVIGHHTIYSGGSGHGDTPEMLTLVDPILRKHGVQAYIHGHDHDLQHIRRGGINYICCGAGSEVRPVQPIDGTVFCRAQSGFAVVSLDAHSITLEFRDFAGATLYRSAIPLTEADVGRAA